MSRARSRERKRRKRLEAGLHDAIIKAREADAQATGELAPMPGNGELWQLLRTIERSHLRVWDVARDIDCTEDEKAMIAQAVAPRLAAMTSSAVFRRHEWGN